MEILTKTTAQQLVMGYILIGIFTVIAIYLLVRFVKKRKSKKKPNKLVGKPNPHYYDNTLRKE